MKKISTFQIRNLLRTKLDHLERPLFEETLRGDPEKALKLAVMASPQLKGILAVGLWQAKTPPRAYREFLDAVWSKSHGAIIDRARSRKRLAQMFEHASFPIPPDWPETVTVWRGTSQMSATEAAKGYSWTTDRDVACWFAMRFDGNDQRLLLKARVAKAEIKYFSNDREESEALLVRQPKSIEIDGNIADWVQGSERRKLV